MVPSVPCNNMPALVQRPGVFGPRPVWFPQLPATAGMFTPTMQPCEPTGCVSSEVAKAAKCVASPKQEEEDTRTTLILRNIPNNYTRDVLVALLDAEGFKDDYSFVYLPTDFKTLAAFGYAFVCFSEPGAAQRAMRHFQGFSRWALPSRKVCEPCWSDPIQGVRAHVERYRNSPIMHDSVPDEYKPALFAKGRRVAFPKPTKLISRPKGRPGADGGRVSVRDGPHWGKRS